MITLPPAPACLSTFLAAPLAGATEAARTTGQDWRPMGSVASTDARVSGKVEVQGGQVQLLNNVSVTAFDRTAHVSLTRGGDLLVCSTSEFHLLRSSDGMPLIFGLDRGAVELHTGSQAGDIVITPDLKLAPVTKGQYDLRVRVTREGDTCVDNAGAGAPVLNVTDPFSSASYRVLPGQHLLFVKGDLHKVVDHERSPCGCPPAINTQTAGGKPGGKLTPAEAAAAAHPFPEAQSQGLAPTPEVANAAPTGTASSQVTTTFSYGEGQGRPPSVGDTPASGATGVAGAAPATQQGGFFHAIGHFFRRLFGRGDKH